jgi:hypothetical protein
MKVVSQNFSRYIHGNSVGDPGHFGADPDPDPQIRTSD